MNKKEREFIKTVWKYYKTHGRRSLPWRTTKNPYHILVSEIMLQQTQVERVIPKYTSFLKRFSTVKKLASASLGDVLREWQGLGYNRRAKMLHLCANKIVNEHNGKFPQTHKALMELHGVGHYTAGAIMAFAYNKPVPIIETNIRTVFMHHFFNDVHDVHNRECIRYVEHTLDSKNPREWYWALMDYGAFLKKTKGNLNIQSKHYTKQTVFKNSDRHIRGVILKQLVVQKISRSSFHKKLPFAVERVDAQLERLFEEGMIVKRGQIYALP